MNRRTRIPVLLGALALALPGTAAGAEDYVPFVSDFPEPAERYVPFVSDFPRPVAPVGDPEPAPGGVAWDGLPEGIVLALAASAALVLLTAVRRRHPAAPRPAGC